MARSYRHRPRHPPHVKPEHDPSIPQVFRKRDQYILRMIQAMYNQKDIFEKPDSPDAQLFIQSNKNAFSRKDVEATSHAVFEQLIEQCIHGHRVADTDDQRKTPMKGCEPDQTAKCEDRICNVITVLSKSKQLCRATMYEDYEITLLVHQPLYILRNRRINSKRIIWKQRKKAGEASSPPVHVEGENIETSKPLQMDVNEYRAPDGEIILDEDSERFFAAPSSNVIVSTTSGNQVFDVVDPQLTFKNCNSGNEQQCTIPPLQVNSLSPFPLNFNLESPPAGLNSTWEWEEFEQNFLVQSGNNIGRSDLTSTQCPTPEHVPLGSPYLNTLASTSSNVAPDHISSQCPTNCHGSTKRGADTELYPIPRKPDRSRLDDTLVILDNFSTETPGDLQEQPAGIASIDASQEYLDFDDLFKE